MPPPLGTEISWRWQESCNFSPKNKNEPRSKLDPKGFELFSRLASDIQWFYLHQILHIFIIILYIDACPSAHGVVGTQDVLLKLIQVWVGCVPWPSLKSRAQEKLHLELWSGCWTWHTSHDLHTPNFSAYKTADDQTVESGRALS